MATQTPNLGLKKPAGSDYVLIGDFNDNADIIDTTTGKLTNLNTAIKTNLVAAINEARLTGGANAPYIGDDGNWYEWDAATSQYIDTGVQAAGSLWYTGDAITGTSLVLSVFDTDVSYAHPYDLYLNILTGNVYMCVVGGDTTTATWQYVCNIKGAQGDSGTGNNWYSGNAITGTSTTPAVYATGIEMVLAGDRYMNNATGANLGNVYKCTTGGDATTALWVFDCNIKGADGSGSGTVKSVNSIDPDGNGNIVLDAADVGADESGAASDAVSVHDSNSNAHGTLFGNKQGKITATGILKGDGLGGISAATAGTDYQSPLTAETDYATPAQLTAKQDIPLSATVLPASGAALSANTVYTIPDTAKVGTYVFTPPASGWAHGTFTTGSTVAVTFATGAKFLGSEPTIEASKTYEFDVSDSVWAIQEVAS